MKRFFKGRDSLHECLRSFVRGTSPRRGLRGIRRRGLAPNELVEKDRPILDAAIAGGCTRLLTGDTRHFGAWMGKNVAGVKIVSQRMMVEELRGR